MAPSADLVGNSFINQYYNVLHQTPTVVHRFYTDESKLVRPSSDDTETATTQQDIHTKIMSMDFTDFKAEIKTVDSQNSQAGGVIVMVTGTLSCKSAGKRGFVQTFFLAPQEKGYFVLNDILRYVDDGATKASSYSMANGVAESTVSSVPETDEQLAADDLVVEDELSPEEQYVVAEQPVELEAEDELNAEPQVIEEPVVEAVPEDVPPPPVEVQEEPAKKSYASIVNQLRNSGGAFQSQPKPSPKIAPTRLPTPTAVAPETTEEPSVDAEGDKRAVYVKNLPLDVSEQQIEAEFKKFGVLKPGGIQVRTQKQQSGCYAFIAFVDQQSAMNAVQASGLQFAGRVVHIEEKKAGPAPRRFSSERSGGGGGGGRGRNFYGGGGRGDRESGNSRGGFSSDRESGNRGDRGDREGGGGGGRGFGRRGGSNENVDEGGFRRYENPRSQRRASGSSNGGRSFRGNGE